jgi:hypothetical protein
MQDYSIIVSEYALGPFVDKIINIIIMWIQFKVKYRINNAGGCGNGTTGTGRERFSSFTSQNYNGDY